MDYFVEDEWEEQEDGRIRVTFSIVPNGQYVSFLLMFGKEVEIIEPQWLYEEWLREVKEMLRVES